MNIVVVVQARTGSTRLPGKVMLPLAGVPLLLRVVERIRAASLPSHIVVATTSLPDDEVVRDICFDAGVDYFLGHPTDLLDRHYRAALEYKADVVVKIPSDCPLIDPDVIDRVIGAYCELGGYLDYCSNLHPASWPDGQDVEVISMATIEQAWQKARLPMEREHTTPWIWERPEEFRIGNVRWGRGDNLSMSHRWTVDYLVDYTFVSKVYDALAGDHQGRPFGVETILEYLEAHPNVAAINAHLAGVNWYRHHLDQLHTITPEMTRKIHELQREETPWH